MKLVNGVGLNSWVNKEMCVWNSEIGNVAKPAVLYGSRLLDWWVMCEQVVCERMNEDILLNDKVGNLIDH